MNNRRLRFQRLQRWPAFWAFALMFWLLLLTPTQARANYSDGGHSVNTISEGCLYNYNLEVQTLITDGFPNGYVTFLGIGPNPINPSDGLSCNFYIYFAPGSNAYVGDIWSVSCGTGLALDMYASGGCSPTNGIQSGKRVGNDTCNCGGATPGSTGGVSAGEPIDVGSGNVAYHVTDYVTAGANPLQLTRYYNSRSNFSGMLGPQWQTNFDRYIYWTQYSTVATVVRPNGQQLVFNLVSGVWTPDGDVDYTLTQSGSTWTLKAPDDTVEAYTNAASGFVALLNSITLRNGYTQTLTYSTSVQQQLASVSDSYSRSLAFAYNSNGTLASVTTPDTTTISYGYTIGTEGALLTSASYATSPTSTLTYAYGNSTVPTALTRITDENGNTYATWTYDAYGRGLTSQLGSGVNLTTVAYNDTTGSRTVTNALSVTDTYTFTPLVNVSKVTQISRAATSTTAAATETFTYDSNGYLASLTDWNGNQTTYTNNSHGLPTTINEAVGSSVARTTTTVYDPTFVHLPDSVTTPGLTTSFTYDGSGNVLTRKLTDTTTTTIPYSTNGQTRTWTFTYDTTGHALTAKSPNTNTTTFTYDSSGALTSITDALTHATHVTAHTGGGQPLTFTDPNSVTTTLTYDPRQRLLTSSVSTSGGARTTTYSYDAAGNLTKTTLPDNSYLANTYDTAHRITKITDALGNYTSYTLDALGDRTQANVYDSSSTLRRQHSGTFDALGRTLTDVGGVGQTTTFTYDKNGNTLTVKDGLNHTTTRVFDALNRLTTSTDANSGVVHFAYDAHDRPLTVTDQNTHATAYVYTGFGDRTQQASPDSGTTVYHFDADANLTSKTDALSVVTNYTYDALDRVLTTTYPADSTLNVSYGYDTSYYGYGSGDVGRLTTRNDKAGFWAWDYDERGNVIYAYHPYSPYLNFAYQYDAANRIGNIYFPDGFIVGYGRDAMGNVTSVNYDNPGGPVHLPFATLTYAPFGPATAISYVNGITATNTLDQDYRTTAIAASGGGTTFQNLTYTYDAANNLKTVTDAVSAANSQTLGYDVLNRLTSAASGTGGYGSLTYTYDNVGNRLTQVAGSTTTTYGYTSGTNRLASLTSGGAITVSTNANGNITSIPPAGSTSLATFAYSAANRLASVTGSPLAATFVYDDAGQRFTKTNPGSAPITYAYGLDGALLEENNNGSVADYIYVNGIPIGVAETSGTTTTENFILPDRLGTPQIATDASRTVKWSTLYQPFGTTGLITGSITQNLRFPGQYADVETGFSYNLNRDYMPNIGRYLEADPIGLAGGLSAYGYANANPGRFIDRWGLESPTPQDIFNPDGTLSQGAINNARMAIPANKIANPEVPSGFAKYSTQQYSTPSGQYETHFYQNPTTGETCYGLDYKTKASGNGPNPLNGLEQDQSTPYPPYLGGNAPGASGPPKPKGEWWDPIQN